MKDHNLILFARTMADRHNRCLTRGADITGITRRCAGNERTLQEAQTLFAEKIRSGKADAAMKWFVYNFYFISDQLRRARKRLPVEIVRNLYSVTTEKVTIPRVFDLAAGFTDVNNGCVDPRKLTSFLLAYQEISGLSNSELQCLGEAFRHALLESIRRAIAPAPHTGEAHPHTGDTHATGEDGTQALLLNCTMSLRVISTLENPAFFEDASVIERILLQDPGGDYPRMDQHSRKYYRKIVEQLAHSSKYTERDVALRVLQLAEAGDGRTAHIGYYLIDEGVKQTERIMDIRLPRRQRTERIIRRHPLFFYLGAILLLTAAATAWVFYSFLRLEALQWQALTTVLVFICASQAAITVVNQLSSMLVAARILPKMNFDDGIPAACRTLVVIPAMLTGEKELDALLYDLEVRWLANVDENLHFGLLTDLRDAGQENLPGEDQLLQLAQQKIGVLNLRYPAGTGSRFYLFHRPREWNAAERLWMGYERKRGKLMDLNALLYFGRKESFSVITGKQDILGSVRFVITLDSDTRLPIGAAKKLVGTMAHPLNKAVYCPKKRIIKDGFGILQPKVGVYYRETSSTPYVYLNETDAGVDAYTRASVDLYQDLFGQGSFTGKGIYDVEAVMKTLWHRLPENRILSHDLLEGCFARSGLVSDVRLHEAYPENYFSDMQRRHRWTRGDWQIVEWLLPRIPDGTGKYGSNRLPALARWKIFDNLRRSLVPIATFFLLVLDWTVLQATPRFTLVILLFYTIAVWMDVIGQLLRRGRDIFNADQWGFAGRCLVKGILQAAHLLAGIAFEAYYLLHAILCSIWRQTISRRKLLEWSYSDNRGSSATPIADLYRLMAVPVLLSLSLLIFGVATRGGSSLVMLLLTLAWILFPVASSDISRKKEKPASRLTQKQQRFLRRLALNTWAYFDEFFSAGDNWLPPDNFQEHPANRMAHYTSPTNMGLWLLSHLAAMDFGYLTPEEFLRRITQTINSMQLLERYKGHFYNWYDTVTLKASGKRYVSTVDSGNLSGHLLTLRQGVLAMKMEPILPPALFRGLDDRLSALEEGETGNALLADLRQLVDTALAEQQATLSGRWDQVQRLSVLSGCLYEELRDHQSLQVRRQANALKQQCAEMENTLLELTPWLTLIVPGEAGLPALPDEIPSLSGLSLLIHSLLPEVNRRLAGTGPEAGRERLMQLKHCLQRAKRACHQRLEAQDRIAGQCAVLSNAEYDFLYDPASHRLSIGYDTETGRKDAFNYDLLASEARMAAYIGIATGKLPQDSWFAQGRVFAAGARPPVLVSWSGTMFEYLMPPLVMPGYEHSLLDQSCDGVIRMQVEFGKRNGIPWGISECGYNVVDTSLNYQYKACGLRDLSLKYRSEDDLVIAPYASMLALIKQPVTACDNLLQLTQEGAMGSFGMYEAIDYSFGSLSRQRQGTVVRSYMVHHQGMGLLAMAYVLLGQPMQRRFEADPKLQACLVLLQERMPDVLEYCLPNTIREDHLFPGGDQPKTGDEERQFTAATN